MGVLDYKFKLNFKNIDILGEKEITEPVKFDGASFVLEQDKERYGRDIFFLNENIDLFFYKGVYDITENPQQLPNGTIINNLTQGFEYILEAIKQKGYETECEFILINNDVEFAFGVLDIQTSETDDYSYFKCKVLQSTEKQLIKRRADYVVDVFSDETPDEAYIEPLTTQNILLKAKPIVQESNFLSSSGLNNYRFYAEDATGDDSYYYYNICDSITNSQIENTLGFFERVTFTYFDDENLGSLFGYVEALNDLSNVKIKIKDVYIRQDIDTDNGGDGFIETSLRVVWGNSISDRDGQNIIFSQQRFDSDGFLEYQNEEINVEIPFIGAGKKIFIYFRTKVRQSSENPFGNPRIEAFTTLNKFTIDIDAKSTAVDTVIKGVRWIDVIKQNVKSISGLDVHAPKLDIGGKHYNNFAFTGNLIKGRDDVAFPVEFKDLMEGITEVNLDYQVLDGKVYIGNYEDFYPNKELLALPMYPDDTFTSSFNERFALNLVEFEYTTYENSEDEENTSDSVHTQTQWTNQNKQVENTKKVKLPQIRDYNKIEVSKKEAVKTTTVTSDDDKLYLIDVVSLSPTARGGFSASMTHNIDSDGNVQLLKSADLPSWSVLGFGLNSPFNIISGYNTGSYEVLELTDTIITLQPITPSTQSETGISLTQVDYPFDNVLFTNRTNEGFSEINGIISADKSSNLRYTPKRNLLEWETYLASSVLYTNNKLKNSYYKVNQYTTDGLETRLITETEVLNEKASLLLDNPLLSAKEYNLVLVASFDEMVALLNGLNTINEDDTIGGFIRCYNPDYRVIKGFIKKLDYEPATERLTVTLEEMYIEDIIEITFNGTTLSVNNVVYDNVTNDFSWFEFNGDYFVIFDVNEAPIIEPTEYSKVSFNGVFYNSVTELNQALLDA